MVSVTVLAGGCSPVGDGSVGISGFLLIHLALSLSLCLCDNVVFIQLD